jgi:hypothetical protein
MTLPSWLDSRLLLPASLVFSGWFYLFLVWWLPMGAGLDRQLVFGTGVLCAVVAAIAAVCVWSERRAFFMIGTALAWLTAALALLSALLGLPLNALSGALLLVIWWAAVRWSGPWLRRYALATLGPLAVLLYVVTCADYTKNVWPYTRFQSRLLDMQRHARELHARTGIPHQPPTAEDVAVLEREGLRRVALTFPIGGFTVEANLVGEEIWLAWGAAYGPIDPETMMIRWASTERTCAMIATPSSHGC